MKFLGHSVSSIDLMIRWGGVVVPYTVWSNDRPGVGSIFINPSGENTLLFIPLDTLREMLRRMNENGHGEA